MSRNAGKDAGPTGEILAKVAAERLGLTQQAIGIWSGKAGAPVRRQGVRVYVRWPEFARWRESELQKGAKKESEAGSAASRMLEANARAAEVNLARAEIELAKAQGAVIDIRDSEELIGKLLDRLMAMLRALPMRFPELGAHAQNALEVEVEQMIVQLSAFDEDLVESDETEVVEESDEESA
jgi:hypothetical protein